MVTLLSWPVCVCVCVCLGVYIGEVQLEAHSMRTKWVATPTTTKHEDRVELDQQPLSSQSDQALQQQE
jgi:hypothetical protein